MNRCPFTISEPDNKNNKLDFTQSRDKILKEASDEYYTALHDYVSKYQMYLNGDTSQDIINKISEANNRLIIIGKKLKINNNETEKDIQKLFNSFKNDLTGPLIETSNKLKVFEVEYEEKKVLYDSLLQQIEQLRRNHNKQKIIYYLYVFFIGVLLTCLYVLYQLIKKKE